MSIEGRLFKRVHKGYEEVNIEQPHYILALKAKDSFPLPNEQTLKSPIFIFFFIFFIFFAHYNLKSISSLKTHGAPSATMQTETTYWSLDVLLTNSSRHIVLVS